MNAPQTRFGQIRFDLSDYEKAFNCWDDNQNLYEGKIRLVVDRHYFSEGIWIEDIDGQKTGTESIFSTDKQVQELRKTFKGI